MAKNKKRNSGAVKRGKKIGNKLLWVDDQIEGLSAYVMALADAGFIVNTAKSCSEAMKLVKKEEHDIVLVDILMPSPDGLETLRRIYSIQPDAKLAALSSYLYLPKYRRELAQLDFPVEMIDKDLTIVESPEFSMRFIKPIKQLAKQGITRTIKKQEELLLKEGDVDPFSISLTEFMEKSLLEKDQLAERAKRLASPAIKKAFDEGKVWVLFCGSSKRLRASASDSDEVLSEEEIMEFARAQKRAPFQFFKPMDVDDIWCDKGKSTYLRGYPTVTLQFRGNTIDVHFDTGAPMTFFSYEELVRLEAIKPTTLFAAAERAGIPYHAARLNIEVIIQCQRSGETQQVRILGQAVRDWETAPFVRYCEEPCKPLPRKQRSGIPIPCPRRIGLVGRNLLTDNNISIILDGQNRKTAVEK